jgi:hypothetical protein
MSTQRWNATTGLWESYDGAFPYDVELDYPITAFGTDWAIGTTSTYSAQHVFKKGNVVTLPAAMYKRANTTSFTPSSGVEFNVAAAGAIPAGLRPALVEIAMGIFLNNTGGPTTPIGFCRVKPDGSVGVLMYSGLVAFNSTNHYILVPGFTWLVTS